ncbi:MAG: leucine-rich repeat domain-containing protein [Paludibacteraceae bacterium]|nr:leucine-rich repeat domain-containing protein [Paludibacteraceae bacterium]
MFDVYNVKYSDDETVLIKATASLTGIYIVKYGVTKIDNYAFESGVCLSTIIIPETVTEFGARAFYCCNELKSIVIPRNATIFGKYIFDMCKHLEIIWVHEDRISDYTNNINFKEYAHLFVSYKDNSNIRDICAVYEMVTIRQCFIFLEKIYDYSFIEENSKEKCFIYCNRMKHIKLKIIADNGRYSVVVYKYYGFLSKSSCIDELVDIITESKGRHLNDINLYANLICQYVYPILNGIMWVDDLIKYASYKKNLLLSGILIQRQ